MRTNKKGISLIVLVITVIVLAILATTVIISLSNINIINEAGKTQFKSDMASYKELYSFYLADKLAEDNAFDSSTLNVKSTDAEFTKIFGDNVKDAYKEKLQVVNGKLVYKTLDTTEIEIVEELGMALKITALSNVKIGSKVAYTPTANPTGTYSGATYAFGNDSYYAESTASYTPGEMTWVYLGQDENGNILLTSRDVTNFTMTIGGQDGWVNGPDRIDALCSTLYGNNTYGTARNMKVEDVNRILGYNGPLGHYTDYDGENVESSMPKTIKEIESIEGVEIVYDDTPRLSTITFEAYLSNIYTYEGEEYKTTKPDAYELVFKKSNNEEAFLDEYWLSSSAVKADLYMEEASFLIRAIDYGWLDVAVIWLSSTYKDADWQEESLALRPVIVLNSNIHFGEKNANGELTLVEM